MGIPMVRIKWLWDGLIFLLETSKPGTDTNTDTGIFVLNGILILFTITMLCYQLSNFRHKDKELARPFIRMIEIPLLIKQCLKLRIHLWTRSSEWISLPCLIWEALKGLAMHEPPNVKSDLSWTFHKNPFIHFFHYVANKQTNKPTEIKTMHSPFVSGN